MMNKNEFLLALRSGLSALPQNEIEKSVNYYSEILDDRIEDGLSEDEAVKAVGSVDEIVSQILPEEAPDRTFTAPAAESKPKSTRHLTASQIILLILTSPIWLTLLACFLTLAASAFIVILSGFIVIEAVVWAAVIVLYAVVLSFAAGALSAVIAFIIHIFSGNTIAAVFYLGAMLACTGITILLFFGVNKAAKCILLLNKKCLSGIKNLITRKEARHEAV